MKLRLTAVLMSLFPEIVRAHAAEQGFVLLLPTDLYIAGGALVVALTAALLVLAPGWRPERLLRPVLPLPRPPRSLAPILQFLVLFSLMVAVWLGAFGATDPLRNPLTLGIWTVFWIGVVAVQALVFDIWRWVNPFAALAQFVGWFGPLTHFKPSRWIAPALFLAFAGFLMADPAPADPRRLALVVSLYLAFTALALVFVGRRWLVTGEFVTVFLRLYRQTASIGPAGAGIHGWRILRLGAPALPLAVLMLVLLGSGSFDGLNETFWWLGLLDVNPLEFPGRSAVVVPNVVGLIAYNTALIASYTISIALGLWLAGGGAGFGAAFRTFAPSILPIAAGYHLAHYFPSFLVDGQHVLSLLSHELGLGERHVTTGFFNRLDSVRVIWSVLVGAVVLGHVIAILVAHSLALRLLGDARRATLSQLPLAAFMVGYTVFGLWLLAAPKGA